MSKHNDWGQIRKVSLGVRSNKLCGFICRAIQLFLVSLFSAKLRVSYSTHYCGTYTKIKMIQSRLACNVTKYDMQIHEAFHNFFLKSELQPQNLDSSDFLVATSLAKRNLLAKNVAICKAFLWSSLFVNCMITGKLSFSLPSIFSSVSKELFVKLKWDKACNR